PTRTHRRTRAVATRAACTSRNASSPAVRRRGARRTRGASCAPPTPAETGRSRGSSSRRLPLAPELAEQGTHLGGLERLAALARVVEEAAPGLGAELVSRDLLLDERDDVRRIEPVNDQEALVATDRIGQVLGRDRGAGGRDDRLRRDAG